MCKEVVEKAPEIKVSIDRLTVVADYPSDRLDHDMREWLKKPFVQDISDGIQVVDERNCYFDDFGNRHAPVAPEQVAFIHSPKFCEISYELILTLIMAWIARVVSGFCN